jgi:hypothetical protein
MKMVGVGSETVDLASQKKKEFGKRGRLLRLTREETQTDETYSAKEMRMTENGIASCCRCRCTGCIATLT